jgi:ElaB/YqjD/DUF883 family membrane-anchored ribosome-binding protein
MNMNANPSISEAAGPAPNGSAPSELKNLIADIEDLLAKASHIDDADVANLRDTLRQKLASARAGLSAGGQRIADTARSAASATDGYVHRSPWQAIGIAAAAGAVMGFVLARR